MVPVLRTLLNATVRGYAVVPTIAMIASIFIAFSPLEPWLKVLIIVLVLAPPTLAWAHRVFRGGEETPTDIAITEQGIFAVGVPLPHVLPVLAAASSAYFRRRPLPRPVGVVRGSPAESANAVLEASASLPETVSVAEKPVEPPRDAGKLE